MLLQPCRIRERVFGPLAVGLEMMMRDAHPKFQVLDSIILATLTHKEAICTLFPISEMRELQKLLLKVERRQHRALVNHPQMHTEKKPRVLDNTNCLANLVLSSRWEGVTCAEALPGIWIEECQVDCRCHTWTPILCRAFQTLTQTAPLRIGLFSTHQGTEWSIHKLQQTKTLFYRAPS